MTRDSIAIPLAIVVAAGLIAGAIYFNGSHPNPANNPIAANPTGTKAPLRHADSTDHIRGNPNAPIMLIEYSDFECPYCKIFHETLTKVMNEYGPSGKIAWTYRHLPIKQLHPNAPKIAEASECVTQTGGDFWKFADTIFGSREIKEFTDMSKVSDYAVRAGSNKTQFETCLSSGRNAQKVTDSITEFVSVTGGNIGTPHTFIVVGDQSYPIEGAQPYETVKQIIDNLITQMDGGKVKAPAAAPTR